MIEASCHCGAVKIEVLRLPGSLTQCTCSLCRRYGALWAYCTRSTARVSSAPESAAAYSWNDREIEFYHCKECGCVTHYESSEKTPDSRIAVNARMIDPADVSGIKIRTFDGADTWKYLD